MYRLFVYTSWVHSAGRSGSSIAFNGRDTGDRLTALPALQVPSLFPSHPHLPGWVCVAITEVAASVAGAARCMATLNDAAWLTGLATLHPRRFGGNLQRRQTGIAAPSVIQAGN